MSTYMTPEFKNFLGSAITLMADRPKVVEMPKTHELPPHLRRDDVRAAREWLLWKYGKDDSSFDVIHYGSAIVIFQLMQEHYEGGWAAFVA